MLDSISPDGSRVIIRRTTPFAPFDCFMSHVQTSSGRHRFYGWTLLGVLWVILLANLAFPMYGASVMNSYMARDFGMNRAMLGMAVTSFTLLSGLPAPIVAVIVNRVGVRTTVALGGGLVCVGAIAMVFAVTAWQAVVIYGGVIGFGVALSGPLPAQVSVANWFFARRALALSIVLSAAAIGGFVAVPLLNRLIVAFHDNWRAGWWLVAALSALASVVAILLVKDKPADIGQFLDGIPESERAGREALSVARRRVFRTTRNWTFSQAMRSRSIWTILFAAIVTSGGYALFLGHGIVHLQDQGLTTVVAARVMGTLVLSTLLGKIGVGVLADHIEPRWLWAAAMLSFGVGIAAMLTVRHPAAAYACAVCLGAGFGGSLVGSMTLVSDYFGAKVFASLIGIVFAVQTSIGAIAPLAAGYLHDRTGSYAIPFDSNAVLCFAAAIGLALLRPPHGRVLAVNEEAQLKESTV
jgi:MFS family permease